MQLKYIRSIFILWSEHRKFYMFLSVVFRLIRLGFFYFLCNIVGDFFLFYLWILSLFYPVRGLGFSLMIYSCSVWEGTDVQTKYTKDIFFKTKRQGVLEHSYNTSTPTTDLMHMHDMRPPRGRSNMSRGERKWILIKHVTNCEQPTGNI